MSQSPPEVIAETQVPLTLDYERAAPPPPPEPIPEHLPRTLRYTYAQAMCGSIFVASTGGMFLIGYALRLGATTRQIGLLSTIPMFCVVVQLLSSFWVEQGISRRKLSAVAALLSAAGWAVAILIPYLAGNQPPAVKISLLIAIITLNTLFGHLAVNARASWIGDLIPASLRGKFFGRLTMFGGLIATAFALIEGTFLDKVKSMDLIAFSTLFGFGMLFGLANAALFLPQPDIPVQKHQSGNFMHMIRETFTNAHLMLVMLFNVLWGMQAISNPFYPTYMLRDLNMPFLWVGIINAAFMVSMLFTSPLWGRLVDRFGCRPILIGCGSIFIPGTLAWMFVDTPLKALAIMIPVHLVVGAAAGGLNVALNTLLYKATPTQGRSVQLAIYSVIVGVIAAPMPWFGSYLPGWFGGLSKSLVGRDMGLRVIFFTQCFIVIAAMIAARFIREPGSRRTRDMLRTFSDRLLQRTV